MEESYLKAFYIVLFSLQQDFWRFDRVAALDTVFPNNVLPPHFGTDVRQ